MRKAIKKIIRIEKEFYPNFMQQLQQVKNKKDIAEYCECSKKDLICLVGDNCYFLASPTEIVDIAGSITSPFIRSIFKALPKGEAMKVDCRRRTYQFLLRMEKLDKLVILTTETWWWGTEIMHHLTVVINGEKYEN